MIDKINIEVLKDFIQSGNINFLIGSGLSRPFLPVLGNIEKQMASVKDAPVNKQEALAAVLYKEYFEKVILPNFKPDYGSKNYTLTHNWKSHATLTLLANQDLPFWLQYDWPFWPK